MSDISIDNRNRTTQIREPAAAGSDHGPDRGGDRAPRRLGPELANAVTHGLGVLLAVAGLVILLLRAGATGDPWALVSYAVFGASMIFLYLASTLYHALSFTRASRVFEILDHSAIFVLIAGTYTAFSLTLLRPSSGFWVFGVVWAVAAAGIVLEAVFLNRWPALSLILYLAMGWIIVAVWKDFSAAAPASTVAYLVAGGLSYTAGTLFYALGKKRPWLHPAWHLFVLGGTLCHFFAALAALPR